MNVFYLNGERKNKNIKWSNKITMDKKFKRHESKNLVQEELDRIAYEYSIDVLGTGIIKVYLTASIYANYEVIIDFSNYPSKPKIQYDNSLEVILGTPKASLYTLKKWNENRPEHVIEIIREIEGLIMSSSVLDKIGEQLSYRYNITALGPKKLRIIIDYEGIKNFEFDIYYDKLPPTVKLAPETAKFIKISQINTLKNWKPESSVIAVVDEIAQKLEHRLRIFYEMKEIQPYIAGLVQSGAKIIFNVNIKIETGEKFEFEFILPENYPKKAPEISLISKLKSESLTNKISEFISYQLDYWDKNKKIISIIEEFKDLLLKNSEKVCALCHKFKCPTCNRPITLDLEGVSGTSECKIICPYCHTKFHQHCWNEVYQLTHQCPICLKNIKRI